MFKKSQSNLHIANAFGTANLVSLSHATGCRLWSVRGLRSENDVLQHT